MKFWIALLFFLSLSASAEPEKIEFFFLSRKMTAQLEYLMKPNFVIMRSIAENDKKDIKCVDMGDFCFDPQTGIVDERGYETDSAKALQDLDAPENANPAKTINATETDLINCDKNHYFDVFCGKAQKSKKKEAKLEVWIDTSASMKGVDFTSNDNFCDRRRLVANLQDQCGYEAIQVAVFDTSIKESSSLEQLCNYRGLNDGKRMVEWIKASTAKHLIVVTDVEEYQNDLREYLDQINAKIHGIGVKPMMAPSLIEEVSRLSKSCK